MHNNLPDTDVRHNNLQQTYDVVTTLSRHRRVVWQSTFTDIDAAW
jgi:hypothetical protein